MSCPATVHVVGLGPFACEYDDDCEGPHAVNLPSGGKWLMVTWTTDKAVIAPPGSKRRTP